MQANEKKRDDVNKVFNLSALQYEDEYREKSGGWKMNIN